MLLYQSLAPKKNIYFSYIFLIAIPAFMLILVFLTYFLRFLRDSDGNTIS